LLEWLLSKRQEVCAVEDVDVNAEDVLLSVIGRNINGTSMEVPQEIKIEVPYDPAILQLLEFIPKGNEIKEISIPPCSLQHYYNSQAMETT